MLEPFVRELGDVREELGRERERREQAERRVAELERQLEAPQETQNQAESAEPRSGRSTTPEEQEKATERPWWRRIFGG